MMFVSNKLRTALGSVMGSVILFLLLFSILRSNAEVRTIASQSQLAALLSNSSNLKQGNKPSSVEEIKKQFSKVDFDAPEPNDPVEKAKRIKKGKRYDKGYLPKTPGQSSGLVSEWDFGLPALPVAQSSAVLVGKTMTRGAFLSSDKTGVYTELSVKVEEVLKTNNDVALNGKTIDVSRLGGVVRYPSGKENFFHIVGQNMPQPGKRYIFFLKATEDSEDFQIITAYELEPSGVKPLDSPSQFSQYSGTDEATLLAATRKVILELKP